MEKRAIILVLDSVGAGELPDASFFGDQGSDTLGNLAKFLNGLSLPNFQKLGLGNLHPIQGVPPHSSPLAFYGKMAEKSPAKDTTLGHWELTGLISSGTFPTYPKGFPPELVLAFEQKIGKKVLGNYASSGTEILKQLGELHLKSGSPIIYTSADSVFQIAAHEEVIPLEELYRLCQVARELLTGEHSVGRVIARPFLGEPGGFYRTPKRKDFSLPPSGETLLDLAQKAGLTVYGVGKIKDIFAGRGITKNFSTENNSQGLQATLSLIREALPPPEAAIIMVNLVDFDMLYGHRNDPEGYAKALAEVDRAWPELLAALKENDILFITADHGCDPTITSSTDHSREYVPLLVYGKSLKAPASLGIRQSFADLGKTVQEFLGIPGKLEGESFKNLILPENQKVKI